jgi:hypothetical protein
MYTARGTYTFELHCFHCCEPMVMVQKCLHMTWWWWHFMPLALTLHMKCSIRRDVLCVFWKYKNKFVDISAGKYMQLTVIAFIVHTFRTRNGNWKPQSMCVTWEVLDNWLFMSSYLRTQVSDNNMHYLRKHILLYWQVYLDNADNERNDYELSMRRRKINGLLRIQVF